MTSTPDAALEKAFEQEQQFGLLLMTATPILAAMVGHSVCESPKQQEAAARCALSAAEKLINVCKRRVGIDD